MLVTCVFTVPELTSHTLFKDGDVMDAYIKKLRDYVSEHKIDFDEDTAEPCLDAILTLCRTRGFF